MYTRYPESRCSVFGNAIRRTRCWDRGGIGSFPTSPTVATTKGAETEFPRHFLQPLCAFVPGMVGQTAEELVLRGNNLLTNI